MSGQDYGYDFSRSGGSASLCPVEELPKLLAGLVPGELSPDRRFSERIFATLPFRARRDQFSLTGGLFEPVSQILPMLSGTPCIIEPSPVQIAGAARYQSVSALSAALARGERIGSVIVRPDCADPTGYSMSPDERRALLEMAGRNDFVIFEDGSGRDLSFLGPPQPPIKSFDEWGRVAYLSDFSDAFLPNTGLGFVVAEDRLLARLSPGFRPSMLGLTAVERWLASGGLERFRGMSSAKYKNRLLVAAEVAQSDFPAGTLAVKPAGGFYLWLRLPLAEKLLDAARREGISYVPGNRFSPQGRDYARLNVCALPEEKTIKGLRLLSTLL